MRNAFVLLLAIAISVGAAAQLSSPPPRSPSRTSAAAPPPNLQKAAPVPDATANLGPLNQVIENTRVDLARLRVDKWKADAASRRQAEANAESVQRNLASALPGMVQQVRANPGSVAATFKLYRNLNALYDVMSSLAESAGAFGSSEEYRALADDTSKLDTLRRSLADRVEAMAAFRDNEVAQLQVRARAASPAAATTPPKPKKIVVDDNEPVKKSTRKPAPAKKTTAASEQNPPK